MDQKKLLIWTLFRQRGADKSPYDFTGLREIRVKQYARITTGVLKYLIFFSVSIDK